ncbi:neutral amino acid permease [Penicillium waksmanii]|uniref:neutral amino acid permease n=1 Tax=Penicillium waksmanii TaxID=69791 RepID=UPI002547FE28|nr:neutral amino acid permease [Penicillium waksmanii]KAJ5975072.1 neutral amino acid permease [Penicillium waksmanii]
MDTHPEMDINPTSQSRPPSIQSESQITKPSNSHQKEPKSSYPCDDAAKVETGSIMTDNLGDQEVLSNQDTINYRTCSWQKTAALLFSEYICIAIMSFPWSYSVLGLIPGLLLTLAIAMIVLYTSLTIWRFCLRHPEVRDVCDISKILFFDSDIVWYIAAAMFLLNNTFIQALHCLVGAEYLNTISGHPFCTVALALLTAIVSFFCSLPRTFGTLSKIGTFSAIATFISILLAVIFAGIQDHPFGWTEAKGDPVIRNFPAPGTTFVQGMSAFLNISFTFIGQITIPSFIAEMKEPEDFWKSVAAVTVAEIILFTIVGALIYVFVGNQYMTSPAFASLGNDIYMKISFSFMVPTLIFLGVLYASVSARFIFFRMFEGTRHKANHTVIGWVSWAAILLFLWIVAWIISEVIPFFTNLLSIMSAIFGSYFGFILWGFAWIRMRQAENPNLMKRKSIREWAELVFNVLIICIGLLFLGPGTFASVQSVVDSYRSGGFGQAFSCASNALHPG